MVNTIRKTNSDRDNRGFDFGLDFFPKIPKSLNGFKILNPNQYVMDFWDFLDPPIKSSKLCKLLRPLHKLCLLFLMHHTGRLAHNACSHGSSRIWTGSVNNTILVLGCRLAYWSGVSFMFLWWKFPKYEKFWLKNLSNLVKSKYTFRNPVSSKTFRACPFRWWSAQPLPSALCRPIDARTRERCGRPDNADSAHVQGTPRTQHSALRLLSPHP